MKTRIILVFILLLLVNMILIAQEPEWLWAESAGGSSFDFGAGISTGADGNVFVTGWFEETATFGTYDIISSGSYDIFVAKMDTNGNWLWVESVGGSSSDLGSKISTDADGYVYVAGRFSGTVTFGTFEITSNGSSDIFVAKMDSEGNWLWAESAGGVFGEQVMGLSIDSDENVFVTGDFLETISFGSYEITNNGNQDIFVAKMDSNGNWLWAENAGGNYNDYGRAISTDTDGNIYITGWYVNTASFGSFDITSSGENDIYVAKLDSDGNWLWVESAGGSIDDKARGISTDNDGNVYVIGDFEDTVCFDSFSLTSSGYYDIFVAKLDSNGNWLWAEQAGGSSWDIGNGISIDTDSNVYVTGHFSETAIFGSYDIICSDVADIFVAKMDSEGNWLWAKSAGGANIDDAIDISVDAEGNAYAIGGFLETAIFGNYNLTSSGDWDILVAKIGNTTSVENEIITTINILSNYPNPFNPKTTIEFSIQNDSKIDLSIFNMKGQKIKSLLSDQITDGEHSIVWNGTDDNNKPVSSGVYLYKLNVNGKTEAVKKCLLLK